MAGSPRFKVYSVSNEYLASFKYPEDAAMLVSSRGDGATIRDGHSKSNIVWSEGSETLCAGESYDFVAETIWKRVKQSSPEPV